MLDLNRYRGRTQGNWAFEVLDYHPNKVRCGNVAIAQVFGDSAESESNAVTMADAPLMIAEIERLRTMLKEIVNTRTEVVIYADSINTLMRKIDTIEEYFKEADHATL